MLFCKGGKLILSQTKQMVIILSLCSGGKRNIEKLRYMPLRTAQGQQPFPGVLFISLIKCRQQKHKVEVAHGRRMRLPKSLVHCRKKPVEAEPHVCSFKSGKHRPDILCRRSSASESAIAQGLIAMRFGAVRLYLSICRQPPAVIENAWSSIRHSLFIYHQLGNIFDELARAGVILAATRKFQRYRFDSFLDFIPIRLDPAQILGIETLPSLDGE